MIETVDTPLDWALVYAAQGLRVFPANARRKPLTTNGFYDGAADQTQIKAWWAKWPHAEIGCTVPDGVAIIDLDCKNGKNGRAVYQRLENVDPEAVEAPMASSPTGGLHLWTNANGRRLKQVSGYEAQGIDLRLGGRGYVILPGANNGRQWLKPLSTLMPPTPAWVKEEIEPSPPQTATGKTTPYGRKALDNACAKIRTAGPGERDDAIGKVALKVGSLISGGEIDEAEALNQLLAAAMLNGGDFADQKDKIERAIASGKQHPKSASQKPTGALDASEDDRIANAFAEEHRDDLRYVAAWGKWFEWRDGCWREEKTLRAFDLIRKTCRAQGIERVSMAKMVGAVHTLARTDRRLAATIEQWDADPMLLNTPDGVVDLKNGELRQHRPGDYMTMITAVGPSGACPKWLAFLHRITGSDKELIAYLQRVAGYCLTADIGEQAMFFGYGVGANGKGVFLHTIGRVLGDYCKTAAIETFTESKSDRHPTELARLHSARLVTATETEKGRNWAEARIKMLTGGDIVTAHFMRQDDFEYVPRFKLFFSGNHKPGLRSVGEAMRRRVNMIDFAVIIPKDERDPHFGDKLEDEWPGVLQWMIDGCLDWQEHGLAPPEAVAKATDEYFTAQDSFSLWVEDRCERDPNEWTKTTELFASWKDWAERAGVRFGTMTEFGDTLTNAGFTWKHTEKGNGYRGLRVRPEPPPMHWQEAAEGK